MAFGNKIIDRMKEILFVAKDDQSAIRARNRAREAKKLISLMVLWPFLY
ncbi:MAG: hypothetical protein CM15mP129_01580 [Chloroflexota bacterium]|nr:MAG: hypothetical protein CM15mP129_01580 [Chloroflexota bacterium]